MTTSLTESFGIATLEAACAGLYVVSTRVGGLPEILPEDVISFANPDEDGACFVTMSCYHCAYTPFALYRRGSRDVGSNRASSGRKARPIPRPGMDEGLRLEGDHTKNGNGI